MDTADHCAPASGFTVNLGSEPKFIQACDRTKVPENDQYPFGASQRYRFEILVLISVTPFISIVGSTEVGFKAQGDQTSPTSPDW